MDGALRPSAPPFVGRLSVFEDGAIPRVGGVGGPISFFSCRDFTRHRFARNHFRASALPQIQPGRDKTKIEARQTTGTIGTKGIGPTPGTGQQLRATSGSANTETIRRSPDGAPLSDRRAGPECRGWQSMRRGAGPANRLRAAAPLRGSASRPDAGGGTGEQTISGAKIHDRPAGQRHRSCDLEYEFKRPGGSRETVR
jgi:hypothetical protein